MEKSLLTAWVGLWIGWDRVSGDLQGEANIISQVDGVSDMALTCPLCSSVGGGFSKGTMASACLSVWGKGESCTPALAIMPDISVPSCMPLMPFSYYPGAGAQRE